MRSVAIQSLFIFIASVSNANVIYQKPPPADDLKTETVNAKPKVVRRQASTSITKQSPDLDVRNWSMIAVGETTLSNTKAKEIFGDLKVGQMKKARIPMSVMAFADGKAPVIANVELESGKDVVLLGEATVERNSKRISILFTKLRVLDTNDVYSFKAQALDQDGTYGLEGEVHSGTGKFFLAELLSAAASAFADSTITRNTNAFGNQVDEVSVDTSSKKALATAAGKSGEFFAEKMKEGSEFVTVNGPLDVKLVVVEGPTRLAP